MTEQSHSAIKDKETIYWAMQFDDPMSSNYDKIKVGELLCSYKYRICNRACIPSFPYCDAHILEDSSMPFIQCQFYYKAGDRQCHNAVYKPSGLRFCDEHASCICDDDFNQAPESPSSSVSIDSESRRNLLTHQRKVKRNQRHSGSYHISGPSSPAHSTLSKSGPASPSPQVHSTLLSEWERHAGSHTNMDESWSSDANSVDSDDEDLLKRAGVYTKTEIINQSMFYWQKYIDLCKEELGQLTRKLRQSYTAYIKEKPNNSTANSSTAHSSLCYPSAAISGSAPAASSGSTSGSRDHESKHDPKSRIYKELRELRRFNQKSGKEYSLQRFGQIYKFGLLESNKCTKTTRTCQYKDNLSTTSRKCNQKTLPCSAYCLEHIVFIGEIESDPKDKQHQQYLLRQCDEKDCKRPVVNWRPSLSGPVRCRYHTRLCHIIPDLPSTQRSIVQDVLKSQANLRKLPISDIKTEIDHHDTLFKQEFSTEQDFCLASSNPVTSSPKHSIYQ